MGIKRKNKSKAEIRITLDGDSLKFVDEESKRYDKDGHPLSRERIIKKTLKEAYKNQYQQAP